MRADSRTDASANRRPSLLTDLLNDIARAFKSLARTRAFTAIGILTIALGVGATTAIFSLANTLLLRALPVPDGDRIMAISELRDGSVHQGPEGMRVPFNRYEAYREAVQSAFPDLAAHQYNRLSFSLKGAASSLSGSLVTRNYFDVLGVTPYIGQFFSADAPTGVVISYDLWRNVFGGDRNAVGTPVLVDGASYTVIGIAPQDFAGTTVPFTQDVWVPIEVHAGGSANRSVGFFGRLGEGVTPERAQTIVTAAALRIPPDEKQTHVTGADVYVLTGLPSNMRPGTAKFITMLFGTAIFVLLIAAANLAGMQLTRAFARQREIAVQLAIGADRSRLIRQLLTESIVLFMLGGLGGIIMALLATRALNAIPTPITVPLALNVSTDLRVLSFALALALVTGVIFGLAPAFSSTRLDLVTSLKAGARGSTRGTRGRSWFVAGQITVSVVLLIAAGLFVRSLQKGLRTDVGFDAEHVYVGTIDLDPLGYDEARTQLFYDELTRKLRATPGVQSVAFMKRGFFSGNNSSNDVTNGSPDSPRDNAGLNAVDTAFFRTMSMPIIAGRNFNAGDRTGPPVTVINQTLATFLWPGQSPLGKTLDLGDDEATVIGVVRDSRYEVMTEEPKKYAFFPLERDGSSTRVVHVRTSAGNSIILEEIRKAANAIEPAAALQSARQMRELVDATLFPQRFAAGLVGTFGLVGLLLAGLGVYGVLSAQVAQRKREFGIRVAIGASENDVLGGVLRNGIKLALVGAVPGVLLAAGAARVLRTFLFGIAPLDPATFIVVPVLLCGVALVASYVPARRATRVPPTEALRAE